MKRAEKDLQTKLKGNQFRGVNNSEQSHILSHSQRAYEIKTRSEQIRVQNNNTAVFKHAVVNNTIKVLNLG